MKPLFLASESPRRKQLLSEAGYSFSIFSVKVSEIPDKNLNVNDQILDIARRKANAAYDALVAKGQQDFVLISADTEVIFNNAPLGKPENKDDAFRILKLLSGKPHHVLTAVVVLSAPNKTELSHVETTTVYFHPLSDEQIWTYIESGEPMDKAGAYGIQGLGRAFVEKFEGPYDNVVGLPVLRVRELLQKIQK